MVQGHLDTVTSSGYIEGWAFDPESLLRAVPVTVVAAGHDIAQGLANGFRRDLVDAGCGTGWGAFRLKLTGPVLDLSAERVVLVETVSGAELHSVAGLAKSEDRERSPTHLEQVLVTDPTMVYSIESLSGCSDVLTSYLQACGPVAFVRAAYIYILGRAADAVAINTYGSELRDASLSPYGLLKILYDSEEFQKGPRLIAAPPDPGFAFKLP